jgi:hypothetical protein
MIITATVLIIGYKKIKSRQTKKFFYYKENVADTFWKITSKNNTLKRFENSEFLGY